MNGDEMPNQSFEFLGRLLFPSLEKGQILSKAYLVAIHFVGIEPDVILWKLGIVKLRPESIGSAVGPLRAEEKRSGWNRRHRSRLSRGRDDSEVAVELLRDLAGRRGRRRAGCYQEETHSKKRRLPSKHYLFPGLARAVLISLIRRSSISAVSSALTFRMRPPCASFSNSAFTPSLVTSPGKA